jgi:hypothetical protein
MAPPARVEGSGAAATPDATPVQPRPAPSLATQQPLLLARPRPAWVNGRCYLNGHHHANGEAVPGLGADCEMAAGMSTTNRPIGIH